MPSFAPRHLETSANSSSFCPSTSSAWEGPRAVREGERLREGLGLAFGPVEPLLWDPHIRKFEYESQLCHFLAV